MAMALCHYAKAKGSHTTTLKIQKRSHISAVSALEMVCCEQSHYFSSVSMNTVGSP